MRRSSIVLTACLVFASAAGSVGLSSCGGGKSGSAGGNARLGSRSSPSQTTITPPGPRLTGVQITQQGAQSRQTSLRIVPEPASADWSNLNFEIVPHDAGQMCCYNRFNQYSFVTFNCSNNYIGEAEITTIVSGTDGRSFEEAVSFDCR